MQIDMDCAAPLQPDQMKWDSSLDLLKRRQVMQTAILLNQLTTKQDTLSNEKK